MKWEIFKKNMQSSLNQHSSEVDIDQIWGNIEGEVDALNQESQKKRVAWLLFLLLGIGLAGGLALWSNNAPEKGTIADVSNEHSTVSAINTDEQTATINSNQNNDVSISASEFDKNEIKLNSAEIHSNTTNNPTSLNTAQVPTVQKSNNTSRSQPVRKEKRAERKNTTSNNETTIVTTSTNVENGQSYSNTSENYISQKSTNQPLSSDREHFSKEQKAKIEFNNLVALAPAGGIMLEYNSVIPTEKGDLIHTGWSNTGLIDALKFQSKKKGFSFYLDVNAGYSVPKQSLSAKGETETEYLQFRKDSEKLVAASQFGANFIARHSSGFEISTGIRRTSIVQKFDYTYSYVFTEHINQITTVGEEIFVEPQLEITYRTFLDRKYYSKHNYLEIPLMVGYHLDAGKFNFGIQSGIYASLLLKTNGKISNITGEQEINIATELDERYDSKFGIGYGFGLSFGYDLHRRLAINFSPTIQYNPTDYSAPSHSVAQKQLLFGGNIGLNIQLSR